MSLKPGLTCIWTMQSDSFGNLVKFLIDFGNLVKRFSNHFSFTTQVAHFTLHQIKDFRTSNNGDESQYK